MPNVDFEASMLASNSMIAARLIGQLSERRKFLDAKEVSAFVASALTDTVAASKIAVAGIAAIEKA